MHYPANQTMSSLQSKPWTFAFSNLGYGNVMFQNFKHLSFSVLVFRAGSHKIMPFCQATSVGNFRTFTIHVTIWRHF